MQLPRRFQQGRLSAARHLALHTTAQTGGSDNFAFQLDVTVHAARPAQLRQPSQKGCGILRLATYTRIQQWAYTLVDPWPAVALDRACISAPPQNSRTVRLAERLQVIWIFIALCDVGIRGSITSTTAALTPKNRACRNLGTSKECQVCKATLMILCPPESLNFKTPTSTRPGL